MIQIGYFHVKYIHNMSMEEFKNKYPNQCLVSKAKQKKNAQNFKNHPFRWTGKKRPEHSKAMSGKNHPLYGKHHSPETCRKLSEWRTGKTYEDILGVEEAAVQRKHQSEIHSGTKNHMYGKPAPIGSGWGKCRYTLKGHMVRSTWEEIVCNWLYNHGIEYQYEPKIFEMEDEQGKFTYRPDIYIPQWDAWWEVKGIWNVGSLRRCHAFAKEHPNFILIDKETIWQFEE